ncbi:MAG: ATP-binding cassette domain-containing protein [Actinophytocola sp.]|uniref:ABC transporter ATP-binding protein n=1 Tax=Actinophytocola sp. TaxID=1872138 RepID=UPI0013279918|nr:ABC transporter ATP-binding protein [Actinophytocola sp.]MPZ81195.1 ATP-binding cassette domain-containing protein [Actinophytocola sp.]
MRLELSGVRVAIGERAILHDVDLHVADGEFVGLVGPNGSGKSTLLRTVYRSVRPSRGSVRLGDDGERVDVWALSARAAACRVAAVLQDSPVPPGLTVTEVVGLGRTPHHGLLGREGAEDRRIVADAMDRAGAAAFAGRFYGSLSGGERQRVLLARALAQQPKLLVLDEPTNHLDIRARFELLDLIRSLGMTTLAVLHDLDLAARSCDRLVVLHEGVAVAAGGLLEVLTPRLLREVFGVRAAAERDRDGVVRITYSARPLAAAGPAVGLTKVG